MKTEDTQETDVRVMLTECMFAEMRDAALEEIKAAPEVWQKMGQGEQERMIDRVERRMMSVLSRALDVLIGHEFPVVVGHVEQVTVKDQLKAVVIVSRQSADRYAIIDAVGSEVRMAVADARDFASEPGKVESDPDQRDIEDGEQETEGGESVTLKAK